VTLPSPSGHHNGLSDGAVAQPDVVPEGGPTAEQTGQSLAAGGLLMILGRAAVLPAGLVASAFLARVLGPADFGLYSVATSVIAMAQMTISMLLNRASVKLIAETSEWEPVATALTQIQLSLGIAAGVVAFLAAPALADSLRAPALGPVLRVFAAAIPLSALAQGYRNVLNGRRAFRLSALLPVVSEISRLLLLVLLVGIGLGMTGAALATVGASCARLWIARRWLGLQLWQRVHIPRRHLLRYSVLLFLDTMSRRLHKRIDLWAVQALAGATAAGHYGAARSFDSAGQVFSRAFSPLVLASVSHAWAHGRRDEARAIMREGMRLTLWLLPFAALGAGAAPALIILIFGASFEPAAPLLVWVSFSIVAVVMMSIAAAMLAAVGRPGSTFAFSGPLLVLALASHWILVPRVGAVGAAATTAMATWAVAAAMMIAVYRWCRTGPTLGTIVRILATSAIAYALASAWQAPGIWVVPQLLALCGFVLLILFLLGEATQRELRFALSLLKDYRNLIAPDIV
jgi:O-antigen/teichoic acid export membrane protein